MSNDATIGTPVTPLVDDLEVTVAPGQAAGSESETRELWRVVSVDGSTRIFQTKPTLESQGRRAPARRVTPCDLGKKSGRATSLFDQGNAALPTLVAEGTSPQAAQAETELSVELTSVTQAWPSLSPGIRGAVMALIRAASTARPTRPASAPRRE